MASKVISQKGQSFIELAFLLPLMFLMLFGLIDLGFALYVANATNRLSREGTNLVSRYSGPTLTLTQIKDALLQSATSPLDMNGHGAIFLSILAINGDRAVFTQPQVKHDGTGRFRSRLGNDNPLRLADLTRLLNNQSLNTGETVAVVEVWYAYKPITPVGNFGLNISPGRPLDLYSVATFFLVPIPSPASP